MKIRQIAMGVTALVLAFMIGARIADAASNSIPTHYNFFEKQVSFTVTSPSGMPAQQPGPGDTIEFTSLLFKGSHTSHAAQWTATDHFLCVFNAEGIPTCDGQIAMKDSMLLVHGTGGQGDLTIPVTGGTGDFRNAHGTLYVHDLPSGNSDLVITL